MSDTKRYTSSSTAAAPTRTFSIGHSLSHAYVYATAIMKNAMLTRM
jgi:hypothetical protein